MIAVKNKVILVTGGYGYLGRSICNGLSLAGAKVYVLGRSKEKFLNAFPGDNSKIEFSNCDVSDSESIRKSLKLIFEKEGKIDVLINNAFFVTGNDPLSISDEDWNNSLDGVLGSIYKAIKYVVPFMKEKKNGRIINVGSMYGMVSPDFSVYNENEGFINPPHYGAGKAGVIQLTKYFAQYLGKYDITVNSVSPGPFPSQDVQGQSSFINKLASKTALGRIGQPDELVGAFVFLASDSSSYITGHNLVVDGGWTIS
jgi:gluconate 5-dehydrogenase